MSTQYRIRITWEEKHRSDENHIMTIDEAKEIALEGIRTPGYHAWVILEAYEEDPEASMMVTKPGGKIITSRDPGVDPIKDAPGLNNKPKGKGPQALIDMWEKRGVVYSAELDGFIYIDPIEKTSDDPTS